MNKSLLVLIFLLSTSIVFCQNSLGKINKKSKVTSTIKHHILKEKYFDFSSFLINGKVYFVDNIKNIKNVFGNPDSIALNRAECCTYFDEKNTKIYWYEKSQFELYKDSAVFEEINVEDGKFFVKLPQITLNRNTTFLDVQKVFPASCKEVFDRRVYGDKSKRTYKCINLDSNPNADDLVTLYFYKDKFVSIEYSFPD